NGYSRWYPLLDFRKPQCRRCPDNRGTRCNRGCSQLHREPCNGTIRKKSPRPTVTARGIYLSCRRRVVICSPFKKTKQNLILLFTAHYECCLSDFDRHFNHWNKEIPTASMIALL